MMGASAKTVERKLTRIGVVSAGINLAAVYAILGLIYAIIYIAIIAMFGALVGSVAGSSGLAVLGFGVVIMVVIIPVIFAIIGFIGGALMALAYNFIAKYTGGIALRFSG